MNEAEARRAFQSILDQLAIERGDTLYLGIDMARVPLPRYEAALDPAAIKEREERWCRFVLEELLARLGPEGTLLTPTFSYGYARDGRPYHHETSPSETGPFTEYVRTRPGAIRSLHPLNSISGVGRHAAAILENVGKAGYGAMSPFARLTGYRTKFLCLGSPVGLALTYAHHLEHMYGVNHMYHKAYTTPVYRKGEPVPGPWLCFVRYLGVGIEARIGRLEERLREQGLLKEARHAGHPMQCMAAADVDAVGYGMLREDSCAFLEQNIQVHVEAPGAAPQAPSARSVHFVVRS